MAALFFIPQLKICEIFFLDFNKHCIFNLHVESATETRLDEYEVNKRGWLAGMHTLDKELMIPENMALLPLRF